MKENQTAEQKTAAKQMTDRKIAVVTGAAKGIGRAVALELGRMGMTVIVNYNGSREKALETKAMIEAEGAEVEVYPCNVADFDACGEFFKEIVKTYGRIDVLVNNAGITKDGLLMGMTEEDFSKVVDTNLKGTFNCMRHVSRQMLKQKSGHVINLASVVGVRGNAGQANYAASKAGIIGLTKSVAKELASRGITVNAVAPGFIRTDMTEVLSERVKEAAAKQIPMGTFGTPEDVAKAVAFLASESSRYITGQVLGVDGGMGM